MTDQYHSALTTPAASRPITRVEHNGSIAFVYDLMHRHITGGVDVQKDVVYSTVKEWPLPAEYDACDVLYTELPWLHGFEKFNMRAGVRDSRTYPEFMASLSMIIATSKVPVILVTGIHARKFLPEPDHLAAVKLQGARGSAFWYHAKAPIEAATTWNLLYRLAQQYQRVGDFCCGYGAAGRAFHVAGKQFTMSDYNAGCIGYIADHLEKWRA